MNNLLLEKIGWNPFFEDQLSTINAVNNRFPARVISQQKDLYRILSQSGEYTAKVSGRFKYSTSQIKDFPVVGDFILAEMVPHSDHARIHKVFDRFSYFSRKIPISGGRRLKKGIIDGGVTEEQIVASNIDTVFIVCSLDGNFNVSRIERYLTLIHHQKLHAVIMLNKADLCSNPEVYITQLNEVANGIPVIFISAITKDGLDQLSSFMKRGKTVVFLGSSGVGKSTLLNALFESNVQSTGPISSYSGKGKHTTTHRELFLHPSGSLIIDTPGMKELQLWAETGDLDHVFDDVHSFMQECRFSNCTHKNEPGCAILSALSNGELSQERYIRYQKQFGELKGLSEKQKAYAKQIRRQNKNR